MPGSRFFTRWLMVLILVALLPGLVGQTAARAQGPEDEIEALALRAHLQDLRTYGSTAWVGGLLGDPINAAAGSVVGQKLESWTLSGMLGDDDTTLANLSRPTLFNFWASWCVPCQLEFPDVVAMSIAPDDHMFDVLFVNVFDTPADAQAYLANYPDELKTVLDPDDKLAASAGIASIPTSLLIDTDGTVLAAHTGFMTPTIGRFFDAVAANPGVGSFDAADYPDEVAQADLPPLDVEAAAPIEFGQPATGTISEENFMFPYRFEGRAGQKISVTLDAIESDLDPYLVVMAADGTRLGEHDDIDPGVIRNSVVEVTLPADGMYIAIATRFLEAEGFEVGDFRLTVTLETDSLPQQPVDSEHTLSYGASVTGTLNDDQPEERWTFTGQQGDVITLEMTRVFDEPGGLDGYMLLIGPGNETLIEMDDGPDGLMPLVKNYELPAEGTYTVVAARFGFANGLSAGDYTLTLSSAGLPAAGEPGETASGVRWLAAGELPPDLRRATYNDPAAGAISSEDAEDWYMFSGRAGDILTIRMESMGGDLDPFL
ncbi:MAG: redoxin domain-containing protein, partial [Chloroflexi bacterium]|nr:redoxin domain-containing protein [Chloroflexota bacterium]